MVARVKNYNNCGIAHGAKVFCDENLAPFFMMHALKLVILGLSETGDDKIYLALLDSKNDIFATEVRMSTDSKSHLGKKILYAFIIGLCVLVIILSITGIIGVWAIQRPLNNTVDTLLQVVVATTNTVAQSTAKVDQVAAKFQEVTTQVEDASSQIAQNVTDKGLVLTLLPEEREQNLVESSHSSQGYLSRDSGIYHFCVWISTGLLTACHL